MRKSNLFGTLFLSGMLVAGSCLAFVVGRADGAACTGTLCDASIGNSSSDYYFRTTLIHLPLGGCVGYALVHHTPGGNTDPECTLDTTCLAAEFSYGTLDCTTSNSHYVKAMNVSGFTQFASIDVCSSCDD